MCSMCLGATPRIVARDPVTGVLTLDGLPVVRAFALKPDPRYATTTGRKRTKMEPVRRLDADDEVDADDV